MSDRCTGCLTEAPRRETVCPWHFLNRITAGHKTELSMLGDSWHIDVRSRGTGNRMIAEGCGMELERFEIRLEGDLGWTDALEHGITIAEAFDMIRGRS